MSATSGQDGCAAAIAEKSTGCASAMAAKMGRSGATRPSSGQSSPVRAGEVGWSSGGCCAAADGGRLKVSATFSWPGVCLMSDVNSAMKESCRCWRANNGGVAEQGCDQWLEVSEEAKLSPLQQESEMFDRAEGGQQLHVEGRVPGARPRQLLGVERQWLPTPSVKLLKQASYMCVGGVCC